MYVSYMHKRHGMFAQYCKSQAGYYRDFPRSLRRELEIAAHKDGAKQLPRMVTTPKMCAKAAG